MKKGGGGGGRGERRKERERFRGDKATEGEEVSVKRAREI